MAIPYDYVIHHVYSLGIESVLQEGREGRLAKKQWQNNITKELMLECKSLEDKAVLLGIEKFKRLYLPTCLILF